MGRLTCLTLLLGLFVTSLALPQRPARSLDSELREVLLELMELEKDSFDGTSDKRDQDRQQNQQQDRQREDEDSVELWLEDVNMQLRVWNNRMSSAEWAFSTNITDTNREQLANSETKYSEWYPTILGQAREWRKRGGLHSDTDRQLRLLTKYAEPAETEDVRKQKDLEGRMSELYSTARVCRDGENCLQIEPELIRLMATSTDPEKLLWAWDGWRNATGPPIKPLYLQYVELLNQGAVQNEYKDYGDYWRDHQFDQTRDLEELCDRLWSDVKPLYVQLQAYVRRKLTNFYGADIVGTNGAIPAHLLGNMWAQNWQMISDIVLPKSTDPHNDVAKSAEVKLKQRFNVTGLFRLSEQFYESIGLFPMTDVFWEKSMFVKPEEREVTCHASASDLFAKDDFRIKMCTDVTMDYLYTIHHEMGHIEYFMAYSGQPTIYRTGANSAFHEAVGDTMALSVVTREHLHSIGLIDTATRTEDGDIADLLTMALFKVAFLPYGYLIDKWRWRVFSGDIPDEDLNKEYWKLRLKYQGIVSPNPRSERDFDPAAKYHVPSNSPYMCYFISFIVQFQFYEAMCAVRGHKGPLHTCDFYQSKEAGEKLKDMLSLGASQPWPDALQQLTGSRHVSAGALLEYFNPLMEWLQVQNEGENLGWDGASINWED
ncbi:angiotensin-converting enzyme-like isoform X2 [Haliotis rufescens]|nr:angiotensin-converting enzyme-like isoform X2 [Haliotis rufescens]XP_046341576.2 angiotensin-converting enzyme-like isoform X2 [Haliotis rufescens]